MTTNLWIGIACILAIALVMLWWPYLRNNKEQAVQTNVRSQANKESYHQSLAKLEQQHQDNILSAEEFETLKTELGRKLIQEESAAEDQVATTQRNILWPVFASITLFAVTIPMYLKTGFSTEIAQKQIFEDKAASQQQKFLASLQQLEKKVAEEPANTQQLFSLAHAYITAQQFDNAIAAFEKLITIEGEHAEFIGPQAQALYYKNNQQMTPEAAALVKRALTIDPEDVSSLVLLGMDSFVNEKFAQAMIHWQRVLNNGRPGTDVPALTRAMETARQRLEATGEPMPELPKPAISNDGVTLVVSISDDLAGQYLPEQSVFIYAIPTNGTRMPLAAVKLTVADLPTEIRLDDRRAMTPVAKISQHEHVQLFAIISKSGSAGIKPGDFKGMIESAKVNHEQPYQLVINSVVE
ncbi:c-type cytochrome biogenesis protein CcmI [Psychrobium sp. 1_MG-2023]|uniref:c-type cytochrome biogenesis protein CcmI n=1 Tax=Psychrobium sp. 1_MG-2023 TaxID=3062624 RepID=UPI000C3405B7|nr:c-type cytochrome biogenesis protein CcmI [Psychrobium sp. 1_MG-2023]MDP2562636.1 c-type cytochrome biogenesis protein CcmI [Psychrobium sp. 1_MG-2023]PKF54391.1 c-type cytochrome biogenesis protein CcmI [Alteromonadales bacterium alter-6D02]